MSDPTRQKAGAHPVSRSRSPLPTTCGSPPPLESGAAPQFESVEPKPPDPCSLWAAHSRGTDPLSLIDSSFNLSIHLMAKIFGQPDPQYSTRPFPIHQNPQQRTPAQDREYHHHILESSKWALSVHPEYIRQSCLQTDTDSGVNPTVQTRSFIPSIRVHAAPSFFIRRTGKPFLSRLLPTASQASHGSRIPAYFTLGLTASPSSFR